MDGCRAELQAASVKNCTFMVAVLMKDKVGKYTLMQSKEIPEREQYRLIFKVTK